jgi:hypothetical protein
MVLYHLLFFCVYYPASQLRFFVPIPARPYPISKFSSGYLSNDGRWVVCMTAETIVNAPNLPQIMTMAIIAKPKPLSWLVKSSDRPQVANAETTSKTTSPIEA